MRRLIHRHCSIGIYTTLFWGCVHIRCCGHGGYWFRPYGGSLWKSAKVSKTLLPHHSVPRLGSACPQSGIAPWARRDRPSMAVSRLPRHPCRGAHCAIPACGHRGLTGRLGSRSKARSKAEQQQQQSRGAKLPSPVGAGLPAMAAGQSIDLSTDTSSSQRCGGPPNQCRMRGMPSLGEAPSGGARVFCLLSRSTKVSRCKSGTNSRHYKKRICTQSRPIAEQCCTQQTPSAVAAPSQYSCASKAARHRSYPQSFHSQALPHPLHPQN